MSTLFCRHNRFTADCPICSKGTVLDTGASSAAKARTGARSATTRAPSRRAPAPAPRYPSAEVGPYDDEEGTRYVVRLERVPGGLRLGEWSGGALRKRAARLSAGDLHALVATAGECGVLLPVEEKAMGGAIEAAAGALPAGATGASPGRSGDMREELRAEIEEDGRTLRVARWILRPGRGWTMQEAPTMLPAKRYTEALAGLRAAP
ncbi:MAG: hypothetical protein ACR2NV_05800 [Thermoleophilaceae bacterium]